MATGNGPLLRTGNIKDYMALGEEGILSINGRLKSVLL